MPVRCRMGPGHTPLRTGPDQGTFLGGDDPLTLLRGVPSTVETRHITLNISNRSIIPLCVTKPTEDMGTVEMTCSG